MRRNIYVITAVFLLSSVLFCACRTESGFVLSGYPRCRPLACGGSTSVNATHPSVSEPYDDSIYCFNGRYIVSRSGLYGVTDREGHEILKPEYPQLEFLSDAVLLISDGSRWMLADSTGWIFSESYDCLFLANAHTSLYESALSSGSAVWDSILADYEALCDACIDAKLNGSASISELMNRAARIKEQLQECTVAASAAQTERFKAVKEKYKAL